MENNNIFKDACFGRVYLLRNGYIASYVKKDRNEIHYLFVKEADEIFMYDQTGIALGPDHSHWDDAIWEVRPEIDDDELNFLAIKTSAFVAGADLYKTGFQDGRDFERGTIDKNRYSQS